MSTRRDSLSARLHGGIAALAVLLGPLGCEGTPETGAAAVLPATSARAAAAARPAPPVPSVQTDAPTADTAFLRMVEELSEPGGYFDTDNLISNESSYLHVLKALRARGVRGGAYIGVGPDQNFSYVAEVRPEIAFVVDIRRDNLLQHLWFKALFEEASSRAEFLALMFGRALPEPGEDLEGADAEALLGWLDERPALPDDGAAHRDRITDAVAAFGVPLSGRDLETVDGIHRRFVRSGPELRFSSHGRAPQPYYPTFRQLVLERDLEGERSGYLADEARWRTVEALQEDHRVVPVVGDLAGGHALPAIGREVARRGLGVSAFYTSNVEFYLMGDGTFDDFAATTADLPRADPSVLIRSYFNRYRLAHPESVPGYASTQLLQDLAGFAAIHEGGGWSGYTDLVTRGALPLRRPAGVPP